MICSTLRRVVMMTGSGRARKGGGKKRGRTNKTKRKVKRKRKRKWRVEVDGTNRDTFSRGVEGRGDKMVVTSAKCVLQGIIMEKDCRGAKQEWKRFCVRVVRIDAARFGREQFACKAVGNSYMIDNGRKLSRTRWKTRTVRRRGALKSKIKAIRWKVLSTCDNFGLPVTSKRTNHSFTVTARSFISRDNNEMNMVDRQAAESLQTEDLMERNESMQQAEVNATPNERLEVQAKVYPATISSSQLEYGGDEFIASSVTHDDSRRSELSASAIRVVLREQVVGTAVQIRESLLMEPLLENRGIVGIGGIGELLDMGWNSTNGRRRWLGLERSEWFDVVSEQAAAHALLTALREEALMGGDRKVAGIEDVALVASRQLLVLAQGMQGAFLAHDSSKELITRFFNSVHAEQVTLIRSRLRDIRNNLEDVVASKHVALLVLALYCTTATYSASVVSNPFARVRERQWALITEALSASAVPLPELWHWSRMVGSDGKQLFLKNFSRAAASPFIGNRTVRTFWIGLIEEKLSAKLQKNDCVPLGATSYEAAVIAFFMYLGSLIQREFEDWAEKPANTAIFEYIQSQPCFVWSDLRDVNKLETFLDVAKEGLDWLPIEDEIRGLSKGNFDRRWALYITYLAGWYQNFNLLSGISWDNTSISEASQFLKGLSLSLRENGPPEVTKLLDSKIEDGNSGTWMRGIVGVLSLPTRWRGQKEFEQSEDVDSVIHVEKEHDSDIDKEIETLDVELDQVAEAISRLEEIASPSNDGSPAINANIDSKLEEARSLLADAKSLQQHLIILKERKNTSKLKRLMKSCRKISRSAWSRASNITSKILAGAEEETHNLTGQEEFVSTATQDVTNEFKDEEEKSEILFVDNSELEGSFDMPTSLDDPASYANESLEVDLSVTTDEGFALSYQQLVANAKDSAENVVLGSRLLGKDIQEVSRLLRRAIQGQSLNARQVDKIRRMGSDIAVLIPIITVLALPITAVGHTMFLAAIQRYSPWMIPSAFREKRLQMLKQLDAIESAQKSQDAEEEVVNA